MLGAEFVEHAKAGYEEEGVVVLGNFLGTAATEQLARIPMVYRNYGIPFTDEVDREALYKAPTFEALHALLTPFMEAVAGVALRRTYTYWLRYTEGSTCFLHTDRPQCKWSMGLNLEQNKVAAGWPLFFMKDEKRWDLHVNPGDAFVYDALGLKHGRDGSCPVGGEIGSVFFHWVGPDYTGPLE